MHAQLGPSFARLLPEELAERWGAIPIGIREGMLDLACNEPSEELAREAAYAVRSPVRLHPALHPGEILYGRDLIYGDGLTAAVHLEEIACDYLARTGHADTHAIEQSRQHGRDGILLHLLDNRTASEEGVAEAVALALALPYVRLALWPVRGEVARILPRQFAASRGLVPLALYRGRLVVALALPAALSSLEEASELSGFPIAPVVAPLRAIDAAVRVAWGVEEELANSSGGQDERAQRIAPRRPNRLATTPGAAGFDVDHGLLQLLPSRLATRLGVLPLGRNRGRATVASRGTLPDYLRETAELFLGPLTIEPTDPDVFDRVAAQLKALDTFQPHIVWPAGWWQDEEPFSEFLLSAGYASSEQVAGVGRQFGTDEAAICNGLLESDILTEDMLTEALGLWSGLPHVNPDTWLPAPELAPLVPMHLIRRHGLLPLYGHGSSLLLALPKPDWTVLQTATAATSSAVTAALAPPTALRRALRRWSREKVKEAPPELARVAATLVRQGSLSAEGRARWFESLTVHEAPDQVSVRLELLTEDTFAAATAETLGTPLVDLTPVEQFRSGIDALGHLSAARRVDDPVDAAAARRLPEAMAREMGVIPLRWQQGTLVVAFAWPDDDAVSSTRAILGSTIRPVIARRSQIEAAIARHLGRPRLTDVLLHSGLVRADQLEAAAAHAERTGLRVGAALVSLGYVDETQLSAHLAEQHNLPLFQLRGHEPDPDVVRLIPKGFCRERQVLPLSQSDDELLLGVVDPTDQAAWAEVAQLTGRRVVPAVITASDFSDIFQSTYATEDITQSAHDLMTRSPDDSASRVVSDSQKAVFLVALVGLVLSLAWQPIGTLVVLIALINLFYLTISIYKFFLIGQALNHSLEIPISLADIAALDERDLPVYTILVPLYRESDVLPGLVRAIGRLDYPKAKLDVKLLLEEDDRETIAVAEAARLPAHFQALIVPHGLPKGKPKACNYGLLHARGSYTVIFDAEDLPDPDQLKKVVIAFRKAGDGLGCVQCKLNYYNRDQNLLTRWFTSEYSMWFDLFLPGLDAARAPIPLGGTSNHFPTIVLQELGAWDPYNVTEDADLGIRLYKRGYKTAVVDSTTYEEANSDVYNWIRQRSRWVKGYIQTWLVHMRHPISLYRSVGPAAFFSIQMTIFGTFFTFLVNPIFWGLTALWFLTQWGLIRELFPSIVFYVGSITLFVGNFVFTFLSMMGCLYRGYYPLVKYNLIVVVYWYLMSVAAWKGFIQLFRNPFFWEKTVHGLYRGPVEPTGSQSGH